MGPCGDLLHDLRRVHRHDRLAPRLLDILLCGYAHPRWDACRRLLDRHLSRPRGRRVRFRPHRRGDYGTLRVGRNAVRGDPDDPIGGLLPFGCSRDPHGHRDGGGQRGRLQAGCTRDPRGGGRRRRVGWRARGVRGIRHPSLMGTIVQVRGIGGYATGFAVFIALAVVSLLLVEILRWKRAKVPTPRI